MTVANGQTVPVTATLTNEDLDGDGLPDYYEENGYRDGFGNWHTPDLYLIDTDGDGLSDGFEAGELVTENGKTYFKPRSDPTKADTDDDGLDDLAEFEYGTDPFCSDTDGDGLRDGADPDPLTPAASGDINLARIAREILAGAVFGETGLPDGSFYWLVGGETASSPYYMVGWIGLSCLRKENLVLLQVQHHGFTMRKEAAVGFISSTIVSLIQREICSSKHLVIFPFATRA